MKADDTGSGAQAEGELLYNGIRLPASWPPRAMDPHSREPLPVPWLDSAPAVIPITVGRQLFVDDFLIERTTMRRTFHHAEKHPANPVLRPDTPAEVRGAMAATFDDGVWFDPADGLFKMWYIIGYYTGEHSTAMAVSRDGVHWEKPELDVVPGTNIVIPSHPDFARDSFSPVLDHNAADPAERFKAYLYLWPRRGSKWGHSLGIPSPELLLVSPDGVHWRERARFSEGFGDCTAIFYNPFRSKWVLNIRSYIAHGRDRCYFEVDEFLQLADFKKGREVYWLRSDRLDRPDPDVMALRTGLTKAEIARIEAHAGEPRHLDRWFGEPTQFYTIAATPYESLMLGALTIHNGPENVVCELRDEPQPKLTEIKLGFSRDGFHWARPDRGAFIAPAKRPGSPDRAYPRAAGGVCLVVGDKLHFYYSAASGVAPGGERHLYAGDSVHLATLRRDGFASMDADGEAATLTTRPVMFHGCHLFVNLCAPHGRLRAEVLDPDGNALTPFTLEKCVPVTGDRTRAMVTWRGADDLTPLVGRPVRFRFELSSGSLYAFWVSPDVGGASHGYVASGGPSFAGAKDAGNVT